MGFIDNDGEGLAKGQRRFHRFSQFPGSYPRHLSIYKRIMEGTQDLAVILCPLETVGTWSCGKDTGKRDETGGSLHVCFVHGSQPFFKQTDECGLSHSAWANDEHHRSRPSCACAFTWRTDRLESGL